MFQRRTLAVLVIAFVCGAVRGTEPVTAFDPNFEIRTETYDGTFASGELSCATNDLDAALETFVRARLYTDGQGPLCEQQQRLQQSRFRTVALPLYAIVDTDARTVATFAGLTRDKSEFLQFLHTAR